MVSVPPKKKPCFSWLSIQEEHIIASRSIIFGILALSTYCTVCETVLVTGSLQYSGIEVCRIPFVIDELQSQEVIFKVSMGRKRIEIRTKGMKNMGVLPSVINDY